MTEQGSGSFLVGVRVLEVADELGEYCGKVLAGLGADVLKIEPVGGESTRTIGPFYHDEPHPDRSLHFWHYNFGKRSATLDLESVEGASRFLELAREADVVLDTRPRGYLDSLGLGYEELKALNPALVYARISPFGDTGPWADYRGSDLVHLALGGVMMNCGYDPTPLGEYDTAPIAPQMWQSYHIAGEVTALQIVAALNYCRQTGVGQKLSTSVHDAVSKNTETDVPDWVYSRTPHGRLTSRHSFASLHEVDGRKTVADTSINGNARTKDGRWVLAYRTYLPGMGNLFGRTRAVLEKYNAAEDLGGEKYESNDYVTRPDVARHVASVLARLIGGFTFDKDLWRDGQNQGLPWAPVRRPEENLGEEHWARRETFMDVEYPELKQTFTQIGAKWMAPGLPWRTGPRAPMLGEHDGQAFLARPKRPHPKGNDRPTALSSKAGTPFALAGVRIVDLSWLLASAGAGRFFTAHGAEVIKVEHSSRPDGMRMGMGVPPLGGREARDRATAPIPAPSVKSLNRSGSFGEINAGKRSLSLNLKSERGKELLIELIRDADMIVEGFSPGTMDRMGLGYERLKEINPRIIYVQQSGMGQIGTYGQLRSFGPTAQAFAGLTDMSGQPDPYAPAGIGYSYLDWFGAYQMANAMMSALYRQRETGEGCWIDSSQVETGLYLTGTAILDHVVNGRATARTGNRSPHKAAAPHGAFPAQGSDRWIAISAFTDEHWRAVATALGAPEWIDDARYATLDARLAHEDLLEELVAERTQFFEAYALMESLQAAGVPAGVCQTAEDRVDTDPQLRHLGWMVELDQAEIGTWPVREVPVTFSETPPYVGGFLDRHGPNYGEDTEYVLRSILGRTDAEIAALVAEGAVDPY